MKIVENCFRIRFYLGIVLFVFVGKQAYSQSIKDVRVDWLESIELTKNDEVFKVPQIKNQFLDGYIPHFYFKNPVGNFSNYNIVVKNKQIAPTIDVEYLNKLYIEVDELRYSSSVSQIDGQLNVIVDLFPYIKENGNIYRILSFDLVAQPVAQTSMNKKKDFVLNSVLAPGSGEWYKIEVTKDGIYKIDKAFLANLGIDVDNLNPNHINIYGNGDGILPELNSAPRTDDLALNAIEIIGESDGVFDDQDYILFYGWGPDRWKTDGNMFYRDKHIYSNVSCYFINIDPNGVPSRIQSIPNSTSSVTDVVTSYSYYDIHEEDLRSLVKGGQRWYGEVFDTDLSRTISYQIPNVSTTDSISFQVALASNAKTLINNFQNYSVNGTLLYSANLPTAGEYGRSTVEMKYLPTSANIPFNITISRSSPDVLTYLDYVLLNGRRQLNYSNTQFSFRDLNSVGLGKVSQFEVSNFPLNGFIWDITDRHNPKLVQGGLVGPNYLIVQETDELREFALGDGVDYYIPNIPTNPIVEPQNLHGLEQADYLIVTNKNFITQAERLAQLHEQTGMSVHVVTTEQVFNEFSSGMQDAVAIRSFAKMFWDRSDASLNDEPKYLLLFGDGIYDPKERVSKTNFVMTYQTLNSENHIYATPTDDFFGILEDSEAMLSTNSVDIGVGRLLVSNSTNGKELVDKIEHYMKNGSSIYQNTGQSCCEDQNLKTFGDWRTKYVQIADDEETNYFLNIDVEPQFEYVKDSFPEMNCEKIYLDAYQQVTTAGGERYPDVNAAIDNAFERGALVINYVGHGGEVGVAEERVITIPQVESWDNINTLPLLVSATCEFTKFDDPERYSAGELASLNPNGAAIALMTTTRSVYFDINTDIGEAFYHNVFKRDENLEPRKLGQIITDTKNAVGGQNKRSFALIGDPALTLALPRLKVVTDSINGLDPNVQMDTIQALSKVEIKGHVEDQFGNILTNYNGILQPSIFDKPKQQVTLSNDGAASPPRTFYTQTNKLYKGQATISNGYFSFDFIVPKDINYSVGIGKVSYYAQNDNTDAIGYDTMLYIGGVNPNGLNDSQGPTIELYLNDVSFVNGGLTDENPILIAQLFDENGINTVGNGIGHDLVAYLDGETSNPIVLNDYYTGDVDSYQSGEVRYSFSDLEAGNHTLTLKAWDVNNNSSEITLDFVVQEALEVELSHVLNYPNPFTTHTEFYFEHNQVCDQLEVQVQIMTISGRIVKTINEYVNTKGFRSEGISWDGRDEFGDHLAKGVYVYRLIVNTPDGEKAEKIEKLVILRQ